MICGTDGGSLVSYLLGLTDRRLKILPKLSTNDGKSGESIVRTLIEPGRCYVMCDMEVSSFSFSSARATWSSGYFVEASSTS